MSEKTSVFNEIAELMKTRELSIKKTRNTIRGVHSELPIALVIRINQSVKEVVVEIEPRENLIDTFADLIESSEDVEDILDTVLGELRDIAVEVSRILENFGYSVVVRITEGEKDIRDLLEEALEEYRELEEEE